MLLRKFIFLLMIMLLIAGCATGGSRGRETGETPKSLDVAMALKFEDVPIPAGFRLIPGESFTFQNDLLRVGILKYVGGVNSNLVVNFYKDQMSLYNWRFLNMLEYGRRILNFDREDQTCIVVIEATKLNTYITITVAPKAGRAATYKTVKKED